MLENYKIDKFGVIHQINYNKYNYNLDYNYNKYNYNLDYNYNYNKLGEIGRNMAYLRFGYIIGSIGYMPDSILDIGVGNGDFIKCCTNTINTCFIYDINKIEIDGTIWINDLNIKVDVITMFDVLEHMENMDIIKDFNCNYLILSVPNCAFGLDDIWFNNWKHRKSNEHLHHFNKESLIKYVESMGYECHNITFIEDNIRKNNEDYPNIITAVFKKNKIDNE